MTEVPTTTDAAALAGRGYRRLWVSLAWILAALGMLAVGHWLGGSVIEFAAWVRGQGAWAGVLFVAGYALATLAWVPGMLMTLTAGVIFELPEAVFYVFVGSTIGSAFAFAFARYVAREAIERRLGGSPRFAAIDRAVGDNGFKIVFLLRLSPLFPFTPLNFLLGLTCVSFRDYIAASFGMIPATILYVYSGLVIGDLAALRSGGSERGAEGWLLLALGLVATIGVTVVVARVANRALDSEMSGDGEARVSSARERSVSPG